MPKSPDEIVLSALQKAMHELPTLKPLVGTGALFTAKQAPLAKQAAEAGWLKTHQTTTGQGKKAKTVELAILTEAGVKRIIDASGSGNLRETLASLKSAVERLAAPQSAPDPATFRDTVEKATAVCVGAIQNAFAALSENVLRAFPSSGPVIDSAPILAGINAALGRVQPIEVKVPVTVPQAKSSTSAVDDVSDSIISFVTEVVRERTVGCDFGELYDHLRTKHPNLTIGTFHDALRKLDDAGRIRLKDWPRLQNDIPQPELALFISHTVMYHVQPAL